MRAPQRIDKTLKLVETLWKRNPDLRFQQLLYILQSEYSQKNGNVGKVENIEEDGFTRVGYDLFNTKDEQFITFLQDKVANLI